jgi:aminoglycoside phosphotransferase (APT) family kinase protein
VDGVPITAGSVPNAQVDAAADILAMLHRFPGLEGEQLPRQQRLGRLLAMTHRHLQDLAVRREVSQPEASALGRAVDALPPAAPWGLTHTDFGGDNLVVRSDESIVSIDNEHLVRGFLDFDVGRTWYRWPMPASSSRRFIGRYESAAGRALSLEEQRAWRVVAAMTGIRRRQRVGAPIEPARARLRSILDD